MNQCVVHGVMLHVGKIEAAILARHIIPVHGKCGDGSKREVVIAHQGHFDGGIAAGLDDQTVEPHVQVLVRLQIVVRDKSFRKQRIPLLQALLKVPPALVG
ncbi:hypothetical protein D9M70_414590 [compost metagenome]